MDAASVAAEPSNLLSSSTPPVYPPTQALQGAGEVAGSGRGMTLDERAIMLSAAVSIDFDYFSRHSSMGHGSGGFMPMVFGGGEHHTTQGADVGAGAAVGGIAAGLPGQQLPEQVGAPQQPPPGHEGGYMDDQQPVMDDPWGESGQTQPDPWGGSGQSQPGDTWGAEPQAPPSDVEGAGFDPVEWIFGDS